MGKKTVLAILFEKAYRRVQRGADVIHAVYGCLEEIGDNVPNEIRNFFDQAKIQISSGRDFIDILSESDLFKDSELRAEKTLLENAYLDPQRIKQHWLDWLVGTHQPEFEKSLIDSIIPIILSNNSHLWIVGENEIALKTVVKHLDLSDNHFNYQVLANENYESIALQCKMGKLRPAKSQFVLWIDSNTKGQPVITCVDEVTGRNPGSATFSFATIYQIGRSGKMHSTGYLPNFFGNLSQIVAESITHKLFRAG